VERRDRDDYMRLLALLQLVAEVLDEHALLSPTHVRIHDPNIEPVELDRGLGIGSRTRCER
jgi:hypothetical protein